MDGFPLVSSRDRFSTGLPGRRVPASVSRPSFERPRGTDRVLAPRPIILGRHEKPTESRIVPEPIRFHNEGELEADTVTEPPTD